MAVNDITPFFARKRSVVSSENIYGNCTRIQKVYRTSAEVKIQISIFADSEDEFAELYNKISEILDKDAANGRCGKLYLGDQYLECMEIEKESQEYDEFFNTVDMNICFFTPRPFWIQEQTIQLLPQASKQSLSGLDFPTDFPFDFAPEQSGIITKRIDHHATSHFLMRVYGPCTDPRVVINGYPYQIFATLEASDYLEIDSRQHSVIKYLANGTTADLYNSRSFEHSVFEKIPSGQLTINWPATFGVDLILFLERSEPKWS